MRTIIAFGAVTCALSAFVSNTATVAMLLPTAIAILGTLANIYEDKTATARTSTRRGCASASR